MNSEKRVSDQDGRGVAPTSLWKAQLSLLQKFLYANRSGLTLSLILLLYYLFLAANWSLGIRIASAILQALPFLAGWIVVTCLAFAVPVYLKIKHVSRMEFGVRGRVGRVARRRWKIVATFLGPLLLLILACLLVFMPRIDWKDVMMRHHWAVLSFISAVLVTILFLGLLFGSDIEEFLDGFKTFPMISPFVCFSAPAAWKDALMKFGIGDGGARTLAILLFGAGVLFLFSLVFLWTAKSQKKLAVGPSKIVGPDGIPLQVSTTKGHLYFRLSLVCLILAMLPTFLAIFELAYVITHPV